jgi:hypothetical protein
MDIGTTDHLVRVPRGKPEKLQQDRLDEIERDNKLLFLKIQDTMIRKNYKL